MEVAKEQQSEGNVSYPCTYRTKEINEQYEWAVVVINNGFFRNNNMEQSNKQKKLGKLCLCRYNHLFTD